MTRALLAPSPSFEYALRIRGAPNGTQFFDFSLALPPLQPAQLVAFPDAAARACAIAAAQGSGFTLTPIEVPTMRRFGWQPEYARIGRDVSGGRIGEISLDEWLTFCFDLLAAEVAAWVYLFERSPQEYCQVSTHSFTAMVCPYGATYLINLDRYEGIFVEAIGAGAEPAVDEVGQTILELAHERLAFALRLLRSRFSQHAAAHARALRALQSSQK